MHPSGCGIPAGFCRSTRWSRSGPRKINIITDSFHPYFCPLSARLDTETPSVFLPTSLACACVYSGRSSVYFAIVSSYAIHLLWEYMREIGTEEESPRRPCSEMTFVGKTSLPFSPLQIPLTRFCMVAHDYTIDAESLVFSRIFRTWLRCILQGKTRPHKFESFSRCQRESTAKPCFPFFEERLS